MSNKQLHAGHRERMRRRFSENGFENYQPHEVLEQVLFAVIPRANTNETAHMLLNRFGTVENVLDASEEELMTIPGIGKRAAEYLTSLKQRFAMQVEEFYREKDGFNSCELTFLADLSLNQKNRNCLIVALFDEVGRFLRTENVSAEVLPDGGIDWGGVIVNISRAAEHLECIVVTVMPELQNERTAGSLLHLLRSSGCRLNQILYLEKGELETVGASDDFE